MSFPRLDVDNQELLNQILNYFHLPSDYRLPPDLFQEPYKKGVKRVRAAEEEDGRLVKRHRIHLLGEKMSQICQLADRIKSMRVNPAETFEAMAERIHEPMYAETLTVAEIVGSRKVEEQKNGDGYLVE